MKWIGQHIYDLASRFRSDVYLEDISTGTIASGAHLGLDSNNKIVKAVDGGGDLTSIVAGTGLSGTSLTGPIPTLNVDASQTQITAVGTITAGTWTSETAVIASAFLDADTAHLSGTQTFTGEKTFSGDTTFSCDTVTFESANADDPIVTIKNTSNAQNDMASLKFVKDRGATPGVGDNLAEIYFIGEDADQNSQEYGRILCETDVVTGGQESGVIKIGVANHDGGNGYGLIMTGGSADNEVDVTVGYGANSVVTIPGDIDLEGDIDVNGTLETDALTIGGATIAAIGTTAITTLGTVGTGVWEGTAIATDQQKHVMHYPLAGYGTGDGTNYEMVQALNDTNAPFEHNTSIGADGVTATTVQNVIRSGGVVMPRACTLTRWTGWAACAGSSADTFVGLFKVTPTRNDNTNLSFVELEEFQYTALGNAKMEDFDISSSFTETAIAAGDIITTALKMQSGALQFFTSTFEVEF